VFRPENNFLAADFRNNAGDTARNPEGSIAEIRRYIDEGIDGFFSDDTAIGRLAIDGVTICANLEPLTRGWQLAGPLARAAGPIRAMFQSCKGHLHKGIELTTDSGDGKKIR
jgi:hypothetical protein